MSLPQRARRETNLGLGGSLEDPELQRAGPKPRPSYCPILEGSYALWITIEPPEIVCGSAVSRLFGLASAVILLSKTTALLLLSSVIRIRNLSGPAVGLIRSPSYAVNVKLYFP